MHCFFQNKSGKNKNLKMKNSCKDISTLFKTVFFNKYFDENFF